MLKRPRTSVICCAAAWFAAACSPAVEEPAYSGAPLDAVAAADLPTRGPAAPPPIEPSASPSAESSASPSAESSASPSAESSAPCPDDMAFVDTVHCPDSAAHKVGLKCLKTSRNEPNRLTLCHRFDPGQTCRVPLRRQRYCIDRFEYPSRRAAHPPVMVSAYDAAGLCAEKGKRMCWESEWTAACEGPDHKPFPYGHERSKAHCNIDNPYRQPSLKKVHSRSERVRDPELLRLDQSVASGAMDTCKSDFGVYDTTGNLDEWVRSEWRRGKSGFAALKGGGWGHVRNACRPVTTSHSPQWSYYFVSFRCCADADPNMLPPLPDDGVSLWTPPADAPPATPGGRPIDRGWPRENPK